MTIGTANPNVYYTFFGSWNAYSGSTALGMTSAVAVVTDSSNNTYIRAGIPMQMGYGVAAPSPGGSAIARARMGVIVKNGDGNPLKIFLNTSISNTIWTGYPNTSTASTVYTGWHSLATALGTAYLDASTLVIQSYSTALRITKAWLEFDTTSTPVGTPVISAVTTDRPTVTWTYSDADGYTQASAVVKIFSSAQYSAGGFSASTSTPLWSGTVRGTAETITPGSAVISATGTLYKPFLQVFKNVEATLIPGAFTSATTVSTATFTAPTAPSNTATWSTATARVTLTTVGSASPYRIVQFRGTAVGTANDPNYTLLRDSLQSDGTATTYDYFVPRGTSIVYGAYVTSGTQTPFLQSAVTYATVTTGTATSWELRSVTSPNTANYYNLAMPITGISFDQYEGQTVFRPLGSNYPIVAAGDIGGDDGVMQITTTNQTTWDNIKTMLDLQGDLYLVAPFLDSNNLSRRWFIRVTGRSWTESGTTAAQVRVASVSFVEVEAPAVAAD